MPCSCAMPDPPPEPPRELPAPSQTAAGRFVPIFLKPKRGSLKELPNKEQKRAAGARHEQERPPQPSSLTVSETCESPEPGMQGSMGLRSETPELMDLLVTGVQVLDSVVVLQCQERDIDCPGRGVVGTSLGTEVSGAADGLCDLQLGPRIEPSMPGDSQNPASDLGQAEGKPLVRGAPGDYNSSGGSQSGGPPEAASVPSHAEQGMSSFGTATLQEEPKLCWPGEEWKSELVIGSESELQPIHAHKKPEVRSEVGETGGHPPERGLESDKLNRALKFPGTNDASAKPQDSPHGKAPEFSGTESPDPTLFAPVAPVQMEVELSRLTSVTPFSQLFPTSSAKGKTEPQGRAITVSCSEVLAPAASIGEDGTGGARVGKALAGTAEASFFNASSSQETLQQASWRVEAREGRAWVRPDQTAGGPCESTHAPLWVLGNPESSFNKETGAGAHCTSLPEIRRRDVDGGSSVLPDHDPQPPVREDVKGILQDHEPQPPAGEDLKGILQDHEPWAPLREDLKGILQDREIRPPAREDLKGILQDPEPRPPTREDLKGILQDHEPQPPARKDLKGILQDCEPRPPVREDWKGILQDHESQPPARKELTVILHDCECQPPVGEDLKGILQDRETWPPAREDLKGILQDREPWPPVREDSLLPKQAILSQGPSKAPDWGKEARPDVTGERPPAAGIHAGGLCATASAPGSDWSVPAAQPPMPHREILTQDYKYLPASQMEQILDEFSVETAEPQMLAEDHPHGCPQDEDVQRADGNTEGLKLSPPLTGDPMYWLSDTQLREELKEDEEVLSSPRTTMEQDGTPIVHGLIVELSNLNRLIMNTHRDLESIRRLRYRRAKTGTKYLPHASFMGKRRKEL